MNDNWVTLTGNVAHEMRHRVTDTGVHIASFRMASTPRWFDRTKRCWVDGETSWMTVNCWRGLAENVASSISRGDPVVVFGRLRVREWERDGRSGTSVEVEAQVVGHDLTRGTSAFRRVTRSAPVAPERDAGDVPAVSLASVPPAPDAPAAAEHAGSAA
jgi:single-strand DNA-binding protein